MMAIRCSWHACVTVHLDNQVTCRSASKANREPNFEVPVTRCGGDASRRFSPHISASRLLASIEEVRRTLCAAVGADGARDADGWGWARQGALLLGRSRAGG